MNRKSIPRISASWVAISIMVLAAIAPGLMADTDLGSLPAGTSIEVSIDTPADGASFLIPAGDTTMDIPVAGMAAVGAQPPDTTIVYAIDVSDSTFRDAGGDCGGDLNGDGEVNAILDCEVAAILNVNAAALAAGSVDEVGLIVFGETGAAADMTDGGADDPITGPATDGNANGVPDVEEVATSVHHNDDVFNPPTDPAGVTLFTHKDVGGDATNFQAGLEAAQTVVAASTNSNTILVFVSDGQSNAGSLAGFNTALSGLAADGVVIHAFAVGTASSCGGGSAGTLQAMADQTGGTCTHVLDPTALPTDILAPFGSSLDALTFAADGAVPTGVTDITDGGLPVALPLPGAVSVEYTASADGLAAGAHTLCTTATGSDGGGSGSATDCHDILLVQGVLIDVKPASCPNPINVKQRGVVPVAILGSATFDVSVVDPTTVSLEGVPATSWAFEDAATPYTGGFSDPPSEDDCLAGADDADFGDGITDLVLFFDAQDLAAALEANHGPLSDGQVVIVTLTGDFDGAPFEGQDVVRINKKGK